MMDQVATYSLVIAVGVAAYALIMMFMMYRRTRGQVEGWRKDFLQAKEALSICVDTTKKSVINLGETAAAYNLLFESMRTAMEGRALGDHIKLAEAEVLAYKSWETLPAIIKSMMPQYLKEWAAKFEGLTHEEIKESALRYFA